ncbi:MAG: hypothetical protein ACREOO_09575 [bacterium]
MYRKNFARWIFILLGVLFIAGAYIFQIQGWDLFADVTKDFAVVLLSIVLLDLLWNAAGGDFNQARNNLRGLSKVYLEPEEVDKDISWIDLARKAHHEIDLQGLTLSFLSTNEDFIKVLKERIIAGIRVRVVVMAPDNPIIQKSSGVKHFLYPDTLKTQSKTTAEIFERLQEELNNIKPQKGKLTFLLNKTLPMSIAIRRFDDQLFLLPYLWNKNTLNTPVFLIEGSNNRLFQIYVDSFEDQFYF